MTNSQTLFGKLRCLRCAEIIHSKTRGKELCGASLQAFPSGMKERETINSRAPCKQSFDQDADCQ